VLKLDIAARHLLGDTPYNDGFLGRADDPIFIGRATPNSAYIPYASQTVLAYQLIEFKVRSSVMGHMTGYV